MSAPRRTGRRVTAVPLSGAGRRLLEALCGEGAYGALDPETGEIAVAAQRKGVSVRVARAPLAVGEELAAADLAVWEAGVRSGRRRLAASDAGRSALARLAAHSCEAGFLAQHKSVGERVVEPGGRAVAVDLDESPLAWLARRKLVDPVAFEAGERLRRDVTVAQTLPRVTADWGGVAARGGGAAREHITEVALAARQRVDKALSAVGPEFSGLLLDVCGFLKGLETIEAERGWPRRSGKVVLALALARLARHYGLCAEARGPARGKGLRHWGAADYRPDLEGPRA